MNRATRISAERAIERPDLDARFRERTGFHFLTLLEGKADCAMLLRAGTRSDPCGRRSSARAAAASPPGACTTTATARWRSTAPASSSRDARTHFALVDAAMPARETEVWTLDERRQRRIRSSPERA